MGPARDLPSHPTATMVSASPVGRRPQVNINGTSGSTEPFPWARKDKQPQNNYRTMEHGPRTGRSASSKVGVVERNSRDATQPRPCPVPVTPNPPNQGEAHEGAEDGHGGRPILSCFGYNSDAGDDEEGLIATPSVIAGDDIVERNTGATKPSARLMCHNQSTRRIGSVHRLTTF